MGPQIALDTARPLQIGLIVLQADETIEQDMRRLLPRDVTCFVSRVPSATVLTKDSLNKMEAHLAQSARLFPRGAELRAVGYGCTSGTAEIGMTKVARQIQAGIETPRVTEPVSALQAACAHLNVSRLALVSPYVEDVSAQLRRVLENSGLSIEAMVSFDEPVEENVARMSPVAVADAAIEVGRDARCDAVFLSCTNLRTLDIIENVEATVGKPVLSSNQVLAWHLCRSAGVSAASEAPGRLFHE